MNTGPGHRTEQRVMTEKTRGMLCFSSSCTYQVKNALSRERSYSMTTTCLTHALRICRDCLTTRGSGEKHLTLLYQPYIIIFQELHVTSRLPQGLCQNDLWQGRRLYTVCVARVL